MAKRPPSRSRPPSVPVAATGADGAPPAAATPGLRRGGGSVFAVAWLGAGVAGPAATAPTAGLDALLHLQEFEDGTAKDRKAKRHGQSLLQALAELQRRLLGGGPLEEALARLSALVDTCPEAADPALAGLVGSIMLRARIELARRGR